MPFSSEAIAQPSQSPNASQNPSLGVAMIVGLTQSQHEAQLPDLNAARRTAGRAGRQLDRPNGEEGPSNSEDTSKLRPSTEERPGKSVRRAKQQYGKPTATEKLRLASDPYRYQDLAYVLSLLYSV